VKHPWWSERTCRGSKASKSSKLAERDGFVVHGPGRLGSALSGVEEREPIACGGSRLLRASVVLGETGGDKAAKGAFKHAGGERPGSWWRREATTISARGTL
jgi:hypothetical protein